MAIKERNVAVVEMEPRYTNILVVDRKVEVKSVEGEYVPTGVIPAGLRKVYVTSSFLEPVFSLNLFPPARGKTFDELVRKAVAKMMGPKLFVSRHYVVQKEGEQNLTSIVAIARSELDWLGSRVKGLGFYPYLVLPSPVAIALLLEKMGYVQKGIPLVYLEMKKGEAFCAIYRGGAPAVVRKIAYPTPSLRAMEVETWGMLSREILQTLLYYRQRFHGEEISRLIIGGEKPGEDILAYLSSSLGLSVEPLAIAGDVPVPAELAVKHPALAGTLLATPAHPLTFPIPSLEEERRARWQATTTWVIVGLAFFLSVVLLNSLVLTHRGLKERATLLEQQRDFLAKQKVALTQQVYQLTLAEAYDTLKKNLVGAQPDWPNFLRELQALAPDGVTFESLKIEYREGKWMGILDATARERKFSHALHLTKVVENRFSLSPYILSPAVERGKASFLKEGTVTYPFKITFTIAPYRRGEE
ncbi:MAG: hypothetical protein V2G48_06145 [bacterium JZ-2024 1]